MKQTFYFLLCYLPVFCRPCFAQDSTSYQTVFPSGIDLQYNTGYVAVRDDYLSDERYGGSLSGFALQWSRYHETYGFRIGMFYQHTSRVTDYNVSADVTLSGFHFVDLYPVGTFDLFDKRVFLSLGPCADVFVYDRLQNMAENYAFKSNASLFSLGGRAETIIQLGGGFQADGGVQLSLFSLVGGTNSGDTKLLMPWGGLQGEAEIGARYYLIKCVSLRAGYDLQIMRINSWDYILASSDNGFLSLAYHF